MFVLHANLLPVCYAAQADWFLHHIPFFDCPDPSFREIYYFRWNVYHQHIRRTPAGYVITEFLPDVPWAGKYNTISCAVGHHLYEGRWLHTPEYLDDYITFWVRDPEAASRAYSSWISDALYARSLVTGDTDLPLHLLDDLVRNYEGWEAERLDPSGLFWQIDDRDGMEYQISGSGCRPTINSYQYGDALAIAKFAQFANRFDLEQAYIAKAERLKTLVQELLWDKDAQFFKTLPTPVALHHHYQQHLEPRQIVGQLADVREQQGYIPWYFNLPDAGYETAWSQIADPLGFAAPYGPSTAERRHPYWQAAPRQDQHECLWRGSSWPFATSQTLTAMANLLNYYTQHVISVHDYFKVLQDYTQTQYLQQPDGTRIPWIDESAHPDTGEWVSRTTLYQQQRADKDRGQAYNHSTYADHIISGLVGLRARSDTVVEVNPLLPIGTWGYFCLDNVKYHHRMLTILYDHDGNHYRKGEGLRVFADGQLVGQRPDLGRLHITLSGSNL
ncbi:hypothetical protein KDH_00600 [Dictyobacter sp. S3.2.2.5]|uniref:Glycoside hydrolase n=1 Tax=Dictyobacter halimunensis TaxID=3026934 RepID=A0ABQ6FLE7_9CHLR|nr:hypothetical protein KDH_00600 [Dictyobacter sp. S3.2.2.5]